MKHIKQFAHARRRHCLLMLLLALPITAHTAKPMIRAVDPGTSFSEAEEIDFSELDKVVLAELKEKNTPGAVIAIVSGDRVVYQKAFGVANVETNAQMQPEMLFRLGSTTKMFTAAAMVSLAESGKAAKVATALANREDF